MTPSLQAPSDATSSERFSRPLEVAMILPGVVGIAVGLHWCSFIFRPLGHVYTLHGFEIIAIAATALLEGILAPIAVVKLLRHAELRRRRNVIGTLIAVVGALPGAFLLMIAWLVGGGDWA